jgi:3'-5' exonuclease
MVHARDRIILCKITGKNYLRKKGRGDDMEKISLDRILFLDIETVPQYPSYEAMPERFKTLWDHKSERIQTSGKEPSDPAGVYNRAGIYAEFGKIICISVGIVKDGTLRLKSYSSDDEYHLLTNFAQMLENWSGSSPEKLLCAHNGKEFDFPYLCRRMLINGIVIPAILDSGGKKPWEVRHIDTMEMWKFGDFKHYTSLELLAAIFGIPTPKDDIKGSDVHRVYYQEKDLPRIVRYCQKDVVTIVQLLRSYQNEKPIPEERIQVVDEG